MNRSVSFALPSVKVLFSLANYSPAVRSGVAQICNLLYRRIAFGKPSTRRETAGIDMASRRLKICATAEYNSALRGECQVAAHPADSSVGVGRITVYLLLVGLCFLATYCRAETRTLNVTDFGARGDAVSITANTVSGSPAVTVPATNALTSADTGKLMLLFGAGPATTPTNHQDLIATIQKVDKGTNITLSLLAGATSNDVHCTFGTQNAEAFQHCVDAATGTNTVIKIPAGNYLLVPPAQLAGTATNNKNGTVWSAVVIRKGGIDFKGDGVDKTILTGCGAWKLQGKSARRGQLFVCQGPVTNNTPLVFEDLTMDGGVVSGNTARHGFPASVQDGSGWDETHDAVVDSGRAPLHRVKEFRNCRFTHWRGEILKSVNSGWDGFVLVTNCVFDDGNASGFNFTFTHDITGCTFSNLFQVLEFYQAYCSNACFFQHNFVTDIRGNVMAICGARTNSVNPPYHIADNTFYLTGNFGILTTPAQNLYVTGNQFICTNTTAALGLGCAGYQGSAINSNIVVAGNHFIGSYYAIEVLGSGVNRTADMLVCSNTATGIHAFAGGYGWSTNVIIRDNRSSTGLAEGDLKGQWFRDDPSNEFPPREISGRSGTNVISYIAGARQEITASKTNCIFALDDSQPERIPTGAVLQIMFEGKYAAPLYISSIRGKTAPVMLPATAGVIACVWTNKAWSLVSRR